MGLECQDITKVCGIEHQTTFVRTILLGFFFFFFYKVDILIAYSNLSTTLVIVQLVCLRKLSVLDLKKILTV